MMNECLIFVSIYQVPRANLSFVSVTAFVPLSLYFKHGRVKMEVGLCKGKKLYDKRADAAQRDAKRSIDRAMKSNGKYY